MYKAFWVNTGAELAQSDYDGLRALGVTHIFWDLHRHTRAHIMQARAQGFQVGGYTNPQWFNFGDPKLYRDRVSARLTELGVNNEQFDVQFNIEKVALMQVGITDMDKSNQWVIDLFYWWRRARQTRPTSWTMEGMQGGWFYRAMNHPNLLGNPADPRTITILVPQAYDGNMVRWDAYGMVRDLVLYGVRFDRILPFYDAPEARIPYSQGFFYLENRLGQRALDGLDELDADVQADIEKLGRIERERLQKTEAFVGLAQEEPQEG